RARHPPPGRGRVPDPLRQARQARPLDPGTPDRARLTGRCRLVQAGVEAEAAFLKTHSFGEFVFDFAWARAYERVGRRYYPKLTLAAPFTPATGPRLLVRADLDRDALAARLLEHLEGHAASHGLSGVHALFLDEPA